MLPMATATPRHPTLLPLLLAFAACSTNAPPKFMPGQLQPAQLAELQAAEAAYRAEAKDEAAQRQNRANYVARRDALAQDPVAAAWLTRMFIRDLFAAREGRPLEQEQGLFRAAAKIKDPVEAGALEEIRALSGAAVPTLIGDLLRNEQPQPRELGIELLGAIGAPAAPAVQQELRADDPRLRRAAARALGAIGLDASSRQALGAMAVDDADFTVRADAVRALAAGGRDTESLRRERLERDPDAFVRRSAAKSLANASEAASLASLVTFLERCERDDDRAGQRMAHESLAEALQVRGPRTPDGWRQAVQQRSTSGRQ
jgi:HEAT repeat protein